MPDEANQARKATCKRSPGVIDNTAIGDSGPKRCSRFARSSFALLIKMLAAPALALFGPSQPAVAQTFDQAMSDALLDIFQNFAEVCDFDQPGCWITPGSNLFILLDDQLSGNEPSGGVSAQPATASPQAAAGMAIERRLQAVRESEEPKREAGLIQAIPAAYTGDQILAANGQLQLPPAGGATPEIVIGEAQGLSVFFSAGATALSHHNNEFEDGYKAELPTVTVGADYWIYPQFLAGVGFNYTNSDGSYDDGGGSTRISSVRYYTQPSCRSTEPSSTPF